MSEVRGLPIDYTNLGYDALRESMLAIARQTLPEWTDHTENDVEEKTCPLPWTILLAMKPAISPRTIQPRTDIPAPCA